MINYQYYHTGERYEGKINLDPKNERYAYYLNAFEKNRDGSIANRLSGNTFIYICNDNEWMMYKSVDTEKGTRGEGYAGKLSALSETPYKYIDQLSLKEHDGSELPSNATLPTVERDNGNYQIPKNIVSTVIRIIDVLFNGNFMNRPQIKINAKKETGVEILKALSVLLPADYMKRIGFCISPNDMSNNVYYFYDNVTTVELSFRIVIAELSESECENQRMWSYVFDTVRNTDNWDNGSLLSKNLARSESLNIAKWRTVFNDVIKPDGTVDSDKLEIYVAENTFIEEPSRDNARVVLEKTEYHISSYEPLVTKAINAMLSQASNEAYEDNDIALIDSIRRENSRISDATDSSYLVYLINTFARLGDEGRKYLMNMLLRDNEGNGLKRFLKSVSGINNEEELGAYSFLCELLRKAYDQNKKINDSWLPLIVDYLNVKKWYIALSAEDKYSGEYFFSYLKNINDEDINTYMAAMLMASAYKKGCSEGSKHTRIVGLKNYLDSIYDDRDYKAAEKLRRLIKIRAKIMEMSAKTLIELPERMSEFIFDDEDGNRWLCSCLDKLSFVEKVKLANDPDTPNDYTALCDVLKKSLLDEEAVFQNVKIDTHTREKSERIEVQYGAFFAGLTVSEREAHRNIKVYLYTLTKEVEISEKVKSYRCNFVKGFYNTLSKDAKSKIGEAYNISENRDDLFDGLSTEKQTELAEEINKEFSVGIIRPTNRQSAIEPLLIITTVGWLLISLLLILLPPLVQCMALNLNIGAEFMTRFKMCFSFAYLLFPIGAVVANVLSYLKIKKKRFKRANLITLACCIIPECVFVISYIVFYLLSVMF